MVKQKKPSFFKYSDETYWRPFLIYKYEQRRDIFKLLKKVMKYNSRDVYVGGTFYLLDLVEADYATLREYVNKIEEEERRQLIVPESEGSAQLSIKKKSEGQESGPVNFSRQ